MQGWVQPLHGCTDGFQQGTVSSGGGQSPENLGDWRGGVSPGHGQQEPATTWAENLAHDLAGGSRSRKVGSVNSVMPGRPRSAAAAVHGPKIRVVFHQGSGQQEPATTWAENLAHDLVGGSRAGHGTGRRAASSGAGPPAHQRAGRSIWWHSGTRHAHQHGHRPTDGHTQHTHGRAREGDGVQKLHPILDRAHPRAGGRGSRKFSRHPAHPPAHHRAGRSIWWHTVCVPENLGASIPGHGQQRRGVTFRYPACRATRKRCGEFFLHLFRYPACHADTDGIFRW